MSPRGDWRHEQDKALRAGYAISESEATRRALATEGTDFAELLAEYAWEKINDYEGQRSWRWTDLDPVEVAAAIQEAREWLATRSPQRPRAPLAAPEVPNDPAPL